MLAAGADTVHFDVMDNHYVPNLTIGPMVCSALRKYGIEAPIDVHLMVSPVDKIIGEFADAGASFITFHPEATEHIDRSLQLVRAAGCKSGLVFNPATSLDVLKYVMDKVEPPPPPPTHTPPTRLSIRTALPDTEPHRRPSPLPPKVDIVLLMSVNPGFGGQKFIPGTLDKLREARKMIDESGFDISLEIDGGVGPANIKEVAEAGADNFVAGSAIFNTEDYKATIDTMRAELAKVPVPGKEFALY